MKIAKWLLLTAFLLSSCAPAGQNIIKDAVNAPVEQSSIQQEAPAVIKEEKRPILMPFKKVMALSADVVAITKDLEGTIWVVKKDSVWTIRETKLQKSELSGRYKGVALSAYGTTKGFYVFYGKDAEEREDSSYGNPEKTANSIKYYDGKKYVEVFKGQADPFNSFVDSKGRLWVSHKDRKITVINGLGKAELAYKIKKRVGTENEDKRQVRLRLKFYEDPKGRVWICSDYAKFRKQNDTETLDGLLCFDNDEIYSFPLELKANDPVAGVLLLPSGELLLSFYSGGSWLFEYEKKPDKTVSMTPKGTTLSALKDLVVNAALHTKDGRIIVLAGDKIGRDQYNIYNSIFIISAGQIVPVKKNFEFLSNWGSEVYFVRELLEDASGAVWINGEKLQALKVQKDGSVKEYNWSDGLQGENVKNFVSSGNSVHLFLPPENQPRGPLEWYVYDCTVKEENYNSGWERFNSICAPLLDSKKNIYYVEDTGGWLLKYGTGEKKQLFNVFEQVKRIGKIDSFGSVDFLGLCEGVEDDIWLVFNSKDIKVVKYKEGTVVEAKLKDIFVELAKDKNRKKVNMGAIKAVKPAFSSDGFIVMADYHFNRYVYIYDRVSWQQLESKDICGENGFEVSDPLEYEGGFIVVNLRNRNSQSEKSYILQEGKWSPLKIKLEASYSYDTSKEDFITFFDDEKNSFEFADGKITIKSFDNKTGVLPVKRFLRYQDRFIVDGLWLVLKSEQWSTKPGFMRNIGIYPVFRCDYRQFLSPAPLSVLPSGTEKNSEVKIKTGETPPEPAVKIESEDSAYRFLTGGTVAESRAAERYFVNSGEKGKAYLEKKLEEEKDERMLWAIKALLSR